MAFAVLVAVAAASTASAANKTGVRAESPSESVSEVPSFTPPPRQVEVVIVWGFRLRSTIHEQRRQSLRTAYAELIEKSDCLRAVCGFVVAPDGSKWRASNVMSGTEEELVTLQRNMERDGTTLVIVHPTGTRRTIPNF